MIVNQKVSLIVIVVVTDSHDWTHSQLCSLISLLLISLHSVFFFLSAVLLISRNSVLLLLCLIIYFCTVNKAARWIYSTWPYIYFNNEVFCKYWIILFFCTYILQQSTFCTYWIISIPIIRNRKTSADLQHEDLNVFNCLLAGWSAWRQLSKCSSYTEVNPLFLNSIIISAFYYYSK